MQVEFPYGRLDASSGALQLRMVRWGPWWLCMPCWADNVTWQP